MARSTLPASTALAAAAALACGTPPTFAQTADTVVITGRAPNAPAVGGFGDMPAARSPFQAESYDAGRLADAGVSSIGGLTRLDASVGDAYNAAGYWSIVSVRGYTLDNRFNYRRDGLPINAETAIALDNKERLELLKGTSGIQAGTSAPGGIVDLVVKRPAGSIRTATVELRDASSVLAAADIGERFGQGGALGLRVNAAYEHLDPAVRDTRGHRWLLAAPADARLAAGTLLEVEAESSRQQQPSVVGYSMLGDRVPGADEIDPRRNLNRQPWGQPVEFDGLTASVRLRQQLPGGWQFTAHAMQQRLVTNDRTAFPYGAYDANYECTWCDRYAPDGSFTYWQFVSDDERRTSRALDTGVSGSLRTGAVEHALRAGVLVSRYRARFRDQVFDIAGSGRIDRIVDTPPSAGFTDANTNRDERSTEWYLRDAIRLGDNLALWAGLRQTRLARDSIRTSAAADGLRASHYTQSLTTPWLAATWQLSGRTLAYASWGQGVESDVAPARLRYKNAGEALPALESRQVELGLKHAGDGVQAALTLFAIDRPQPADIGSCDGDRSCTRVIDGSARHRGVEGQFGGRLGAWRWHAGAMWLDAERRGSAQQGVDGLRPVNVPRASLRLEGGYAVAALPGLEVQAALAAEGNRVVLPGDESVRIPGWWRMDLGTRWSTAVGSANVTWRAGIDNVLDKRTWQESPYQFGHVYLYPLAPRTWRIAMTAAL